jgi:hypothetical protein
MPDRRGSFGFTFVLVLALAGCASGVASTPRREDPARLGQRITSGDLHRAQWANAYDLVAAIRPAWLRTRGSVAPGAGVQVLLDGIPVGGVATLRTMSLAAVTALDYYDPIRAASRFGPRFAYGAIVITTRATR